MITRNRGKSKSVVETLGLVKKNKKRVSRDSDLANTSSALVLLGHEGIVMEPKEKVSSNCDGGSNSGVTPDGDDSCQCVQEVDGLASVETTPAKCSFSPDRLSGLTIDQLASTKCENGLDVLRKVPRCDWLPPKGTPTFRVHDEVLREMLEEISIVGGVFPLRRQFVQSKLRKNESKEKGENVIYAFKEIRLQRLFGKMSVDLGTINEELDKKEAFLASCGLVRPGVTRALRKRRLEKCKEAKHEAMGRLRPNPRPRRFSDMVNPSVEAAERLAGLSRNAKRIRDRNARAAAK
uniref:Uncharacterized protein n=1 Tax=Echinococcus canadensis TaxID=519352 RepID=A0A915EUH5_9CEST